MSDKRHHLLSIFRVCVKVLFGGVDKEEKRNVLMVQLQCNDVGGGEHADAVCIFGRSWRYRRLSHSYRRCEEADFERRGESSSAMRRTNATTRIQFHGVK